MRTTQLRPQAIRLVPTSEILRPPCEIYSPLSANGPLYDDCNEMTYYDSDDDPYSLSSLTRVACDLHMNCCPHLTPPYLSMRHWFKRLGVAAAINTTVDHGDREGELFESDELEQEEEDAIVPTVDVVSVCEEDEEKDDPDINKRQ